MSSNKRALVIGGTGPTGPHVVNGLLSRGYEVALFHRGTHESDEIPASLEHLHGDPHFEASIQDTLGNRDYELVVAMYGRTRLLARHFAGRVGRFIAVGGVVGYLGHLAPCAQFPSGMAVPAAEHEPQVGDESQSRFGWLVAETEREVLALHPGATVLRYPLVYGPRQVMPREWCLVRRALDRRPYLVLPDGGLPDISRGYAINLAHAVLCAVDRPYTSAGQVYNCGDQRQFSLHQLAEIVADAVGHRWEIVSLPVDLAFPSWPMFNAEEARWHRLVDTAKLQRELGYEDQVPAVQAMQETARWYARQRAELAPAIEERLGDPFDYVAEDRLVSDWKQCRAGLIARHGLPPTERPHPYPHPKVAGLDQDHRAR